MKAFEHLIDICYDKNTGIKKRVVFSLILILIGIAIIFWFFIRLLYFEGYYKPRGVILLPEFGQMGDFIGGVSGTLFTLVGVILLFETLALQRNELSESRKVFQQQQFENTFFNLLNLYNEVVKGLHYTDINTFDENVLKGKEFFERQHQDFYNNFIPKNRINKNRKQATLDYLGFYVSTKEQTAHYFRTIYRLFKIISESNFKDEEKMKYAKIVRAQLSESECFFLHYNAYTEYGFRFRKLINEFNIVKHLPLVEKVEFKLYIQNLDQFEKNAIQLVIEEVRDGIKLAISSNKSFHKSYLGGSLSIKIVTDNIFYFKLTVVRRTNQIHSQNYQQGFGLNKFDNEQLKRFFNDYLYDLINYSNYMEFNQKYIQILNSSRDEENGTKHIIDIDVQKNNLEFIKFN